MYRARPLRRWRARRLYGQFVGPGDLCFDIGAHIGDRVSTFLALGARVVAVEPQPLFFGALERLFRRRPAVTLVQAAIGAAPGTTEMLISRRTPTMSTVSARWARQVESAAGVTWEDKVTVDVTTLDQLIATHGVPRFCKIDVEGSEVEVLRGLTRPLPALSFEYLPPVLDQAKACLAELTRLGRYEFNASQGETMRLALDSWVDTKGITAWLDARTPADWSGDIYARLVNGS